MRADVFFNCGLLAGWALMGGPCQGDPGDRGMAEQAAKRSWPSGLGRGRGQRELL